MLNTNSKNMDTRILLCDVETNQEHEESDGEIGPERQTALRTTSATPATRFHVYGTSLPRLRPSENPGERFRMRLIGTEPIQSN